MAGMAMAVEAAALAPATFRKRRRCMNKFSLSSGFPHRSDSDPSGTNNIKSNSATKNDALQKLIATWLQAKLFWLQPSARKSLIAFQSMPNLQLCFENLPIMSRC
jgi:hypothetical protein